MYDVLLFGSGPAFSLVLIAVEKDRELQFFRLRYISNTERGQKMEIELGMRVVTLVEKSIVKRVDSKTYVPKGTVGFVCDTEYQRDGFVLVQFDYKDIVGNGAGVIHINPMK